MTEVTQLQGWIVMADLNVPTVHCRTGSLEKQYLKKMAEDLVHCRTGSLGALEPKPLEPKLSFAV
jgi:hypothetical protein